MKNLRGKFLHITIVVILLVVGGLYYYSGRQQQRYDAEATAYLRSALTDIGSWQAAALRRQLAPEALATADNTQIEALLSRYRPLGSFRHLQDLKFARLSAALSLFSDKTLLGYSATAYFSDGNAHLAATLVLRDGRFHLYNFNLSRPQFNSPPH